MRRVLSTSCLLAVITFGVTPTAPILAAESSVDAAPAANASVLESVRGRLNVGGKFAEARAIDFAGGAFLSALTDLTPLIGAAPSDPEALKLLGELNAAVIALYAGARRPEHVDSLKRFVAAVGELQHRVPENTRLALSYGSYLRILGKAVEEFDWQFALSRFEESLALDRKFAPAARTLGADVEATVDAGLVYELGEVGAIKLKVRDQAGLIAWREAAELQTVMASKRPQDEEGRGATWTALMRLAAAATQFGNQAEAARAYQAACDLWQAPFAATSPTAAAAQRRLVALSALAKLKSESGDFSAASKLLETAMAAVEEAVKSFPDTEELKQASFDIAYQTANVNLGLRDIGRATDLARRLAHSSLGEAEAKKTTGNQRRAVQALTLLAWMDFSAHKSEQALPEARDCARVARDTLASASSAGDLQIQLMLAQCLTVQATLDPAWEAPHDEAVQRLEALRANPGAAGAMAFLGGMLSAIKLQHTPTSALGADDGRYLGGDGSALEKAVKITGAKTDAEGSISILRYLNSHLPGYELEMQALAAKDKHHYDVITCRLPTGEKKTLYFDITESFGKR